MKKPAKNAVKGVKGEVFVKLRKMRNSPLHKGEFAGVAEELAKGNTLSGIEFRPSGISFMFGQETDTEEVKEVPIPSPISQIPQDGEETTFVTKNGNRITKVFRNVPVMVDGELLLKNLSENVIVTDSKDNEVKDQETAVRLMLDGAMNMGIARIKELFDEHDYEKEPNPRFFKVLARAAQKQVDEIMASKSSLSEDSEYFEALGESSIRKVRVANAVQKVLNSICPNSNLNEDEALAAMMLRGAAVLQAQAHFASKGDEEVYDDLFKVIKKTAFELSSNSERKAHKFDKIAEALGVGTITEENAPEEIKKIMKMLRDSGADVSMRGINLNDINVDAMPESMKDKFKKLLGL